MRRLLPICCLLWIVPALCAADASAEKAATIAYLQKLQTTDGGFLPNTPQDGKQVEPTLRATSTALRALRYQGGKPRELEPCVKFVQKCFDKSSGGFADTPGGKPDVASTAVGLMALVELKMPLGDYRDAAVKYLVDNAKTFEEMRIAAAGLEAVEQHPKQTEAWLDELARMRNSDGTYGKSDGKARDTGGAAVLALRLGGKLEQQPNVVKAIKDGQRQDGAFGKADAATSDLETSYRVMRLFHMLKERPTDTAALRKFIAKCRNADGGYGVAPGEASGAAATYFASIILQWLDE